MVYSVRKIIINNNNIIRKISDNNNYPRHMIDNIQKRIIYKKTAPLYIPSSQHKKKNIKNFISTPHLATL